MDNINIKVIDISKYTFESKQKIVSKIAMNMSEKVSLGEFSDNLFFSINIIKVDLKNYWILMAIDHQVSDAETKRIVKRYFSMDEETISLTSETYTDYISKIYREDIIDKINSFKKTSYFSEVKNNTLNFYNKNQQYMNSQPIVIDKPVVIKYNYGAESEDTKNPFQISLFITLSCVRTIFELENIPMRIYYSNRNMYPKYYYTIGNFADSIFCNFYMYDLDYHKCGDNYYSAVEYFKKNEIIIKAFRIDEEIEFAFKETPFNLNYSGVLNEEDEKRILSTVKSFKKYSILAYDISSHLNVIFANGIPKDKLENIINAFNNLKNKYPNIFSGCFDYEYIN